MLKFQSKFAKIKLFKTISYLPILPRKLQNKNFFKWYFCLHDSGPQLFICEYTYVISLIYVYILFIRTGLEE